MTQRDRNAGSDSPVTGANGSSALLPRLLDLCSCEGGAALGYQRAGFHVTAVDLDLAALNRNPADVTILDHALEYLRDYGHLFDAIHASFPCQKWSANGANPAKDQWPDLITEGREILEDLGNQGIPWVMENVPKAPLRQDLLLCGSMYALTAFDTDGTILHLRRHRVFESNVPLVAPGPCVHPKGVQWAGVYGGARKDKTEARTVRHGGYVPPSAQIQSDLLGGVEWMTGKGRRECIPPAYSYTVGVQLLAVIEARDAA